MSARGPTRAGCCNDAGQPPAEGAVNHGAACPVRDGVSREPSAEHTEPSGTGGPLLGHRQSGFVGQSGRKPFSTGALMNLISHGHWHERGDARSDAPTLVVRYRKGRSVTAHS